MKQLTLKQKKKLDKAYEKVMKWYKPALIKLGKD